MRTYDRRSLFRIGAASTLTAGLSAGWRTVAMADSTSGPPMSPPQALQTLMAGNMRFAAGALTSPHQDPARRASVAAGQSPFAIVLGCADSRVPPEIVFDAGIGDLFVVRVAGNAPNPELIASIEYGVGVLNAPLVMVLGHSACGAIAAAIKSVVDGTPLPSPHLRSLIADLSPAVTQIQAEPGDLTQNATVRNVQLAVQQLSVQDPILAVAVAAGTLQIVGATYDLSSGAVSPVPPLA